MNKRTLALTSAVLVTALGSPLVLSQDEKPFGGPDSISYSEKLWAVLTNLDLVGDTSLPDTPYKGTHPHGAVLETLSSEATVEDHTGEVIVKRNYGGEGVSIDSVTADRAMFLKAITVMYQREDGYDTEDQNWFWVKYKPDGSLDTNPKGMKLAGRIAKGKPQGCIACHTAAPGGDFLFIK